MTTNQQKRKEREEAILHTLKKLDLCSRSQLQQIHNLGSNRNASRVLKQMEDRLNSFMGTESIYYLNKRGRELTGAIKQVAKTAQYVHTLMRNDIYIQYHCPDLWKNEYLVKTPELSFVSDAVFLSGNSYYFLEADNQQKMTANKDKLLKYFAFKCSGLWQKSNNGAFPFLIYYTLSDFRKAQLQELNPGLDLIVLTKKDLL